MGRDAGTAPTEAEVRARVIADLLAEHRDAAGPVLIIEELGLGRGSARADLVVLDGTGITGVELKSAADTLGRLANQAGWYGRVCDRCVLAGDPRHLEEAAAVLPGWWGLTAVDAAGRRVVRPAGPNPDQDPEALAHLLWMPELKAAVAEAGQTGGTAGLERAGLASVVAAAAGPRTGDLVRRQLLARRWVDVGDAQGQARVVRQPAPPRRVVRRTRVQGKHERRALRRS